MGKIIYGSEVSAELREELRLEVEELKQEGKRIPKLAVILAGDNPASLSYVRGKAKACEAAGILEETFHLAGSVSQEELEDLIHRCNEDPVIDGILLQLPLPARQGASRDSSVCALYAAWHHGTLEADGV